MATSLRAGTAAGAYSRVIVTVLPPETVVATTAALAPPPPRTPGPINATSNVTVTFAIAGQ